MVKIKITDTTFRDAHQSLLATRMRMADMEPIIEKMDQVGFFSLEVWGGATFDTCIRYLNEDPWERIRTFKKHMKETPTQMLLRGQNLVGYKHYSDDIVEKFIEKSVKNGVDIFRVFDALNDLRNMKSSIKIAKRLDAHVQGTICYTLSPVHTTDFFVEMAKKLEVMECDSICIKDMAGLISPKNTYELVKSIKKATTIPIDLHSHCTSGMAQASYFAACEAGIDILDTAMSPFSGGTSHPPTESTIACLEGTSRQTNINLSNITPITTYFKNLRKKYEGIIDPLAESVDTNVLLYQIPGGMLSNLISQLKDQNALNRFEEVLAETPKVRADLGYPPLVTPASQIVGTQAVMNVLVGERYKVVPKEVKDYVLGLYGKPPGIINPKIMTKIIGDEKPITCRPADLLQPSYNLIKKDAENLGLVKKEEDVLTFALYPSIAPRFLKGEGVEETLHPPGGKFVENTGIPTLFSVEVDGETFDVSVKPKEGSIEINETIDNGSFKVDGGIVAPMKGIILKIKVGVGEEINKGEIIAILEAMKMQNDVLATHDGIVKEICVSEGSNVSPGTVIMVVK